MKTSWTMGAVFAAILGASAPALALPTQVSAQGQLLNAAGNPVDGTYAIKFTIYDGPTGGTALWTETQSSVPVTSGLFDVLLGSAANNALTPSIFQNTSQT